MNLTGTKIYIASTKSLEDKAVFEKYYETVSDERKAKVDRLRFDRDKRLSLAAEILLKKALEDYGIVEYEISYSENGKPYFAGMPEVKFNLSHSEERVMCVLSDKETGCDVERIKDVNLLVAKHFCTDTEYALIQEKETKAEKEDVFFRLWTLKESFLKATGLGMKLSMKDFYFNIEENGVTVYQKVNGEHYYFKEYALQDGYKYAVCSLNPEFSEIKRVF